MQLDNEDIRKVAESIWTTTLGLDLSRVEHEDDGARDAEFISACVHIVGAWEGAAGLHCSTRLARQVASIMFGCDEPQADEVRDAVGELVNMTGGNIKSLLPGPCQLSLPSVVEGTGHRLSVHGSELVNRVFFECQGEPLEVSVVKSKTPLHAEARTFSAGRP